MCRWLFGLTALALAQVWSRSYVQGSGALTTRGPSWSGDGVTMAACDEPTASGVPPPGGVAPPTAGVAPPCGCVSWVQTDACVNCDGPTSSACCRASRVARTSPNSIWSQPNWSSAVVSKAGWNIGWVDEEGLSAAGNWKAGGLEPLSGKIGGDDAVGAVVSSCRGPVLGGYPKNSDESPNTRERVLNTFNHKVRALRDCDSPSRLHKFPKVWIRLHVPSRPLL
jgi:hypothetical protein